MLLSYPLRIGVRRGGEMQFGDQTRIVHLGYPKDIGSSRHWSNSGCSQLVNLTIAPDLLLVALVEVASRAPLAAAVWLKMVQSE